MEKYYDEADKLKYVRGFKNCNLTILDYCDKMQIRYDDMKEWLREYKNPPAFGKIDVASLAIEEKDKSIKKETTPIKFETDTIKIEFKPGFNKQLLQQMVVILTQC